MNILVTGGAGYIGAVVSRLLLNRGHRVRVLDSLLHGGAALLGLYPHEHFEFIKGDIRSADTIKQALDGIDAVVHLAAIVGDPSGSRQPEVTREVNQEGSLQLFDLCCKQEVEKFIFVSTCSNYGRMADPTQFITEESELQPVSLYAETKVAVEKYLLESSENRGPVTTVLRFATIFGVAPRMRFDLTVNEFTMELLTKRNLVVFGEQFWRPYLHVIDGARAITKVLEIQNGQVNREVYNVGDTSQNYQKGKLVEMICDEIGGDLVIEHVHRDEDPRDYRVSFAKIWRDLGFNITRTVGDGIREVINAISQGVFGDLDNPSYRN